MKNIDTGSAGGNTGGNVGGNTGGNVGGNTGSNAGGNVGGNTATEAVVYLFNTMEVLKMLEESGVPRAQAEAQVAAMHVALSGSVATKADLQALRVATKVDLKLLEVKMDAGFEAVRTESKADLQVLEGKVDAGFKAADDKMETMATKSDVKALDVKIKWLIGTLLLVGSLVASGEGGLINSAVKELIAALGG